MARTIVTSEAEEGAAVAYSKLMSKISGPYKILSVADNTLKILGNALEHVTSMNRETSTPGLLKSHVTNGDSRHMEEKALQVQFHVTRDGDNKKFVVDEVMRHITEISYTKYVVWLYEYPDEKDTVNPMHHLPQRFVTRYRCTVKRLNY